MGTLSPLLAGQRIKLTRTPRGIQPESFVKSPKCTSRTKPKITTRPYHNEIDLSWLHELWQETMGPRWSISPLELQKKLSGVTLGLVAEEEGTPVGFCAVGYREKGPAGLLLLLVKPAYQRRGIGSLLLDRQEARLRANGVDRLNAGFGNNGDYFWPGVPADVVSAGRFLTKHGWEDHEPSFDLVQELGEYCTPAWVYNRLKTTAVSFRLAGPALREKILDFEQSRFPAWAEFFRNAMAESEYQNILLALDSEETVVGALILRAHVPAVWDVDREARFGTLNLLGVTPGEQGKGIGIALAAKAFEILRERQCRVCYVQWTGLVNWYGKLGATTWAEYRMRSKNLL